MENFHFKVSLSLCAGGRADRDFPLEDSIQPSSRSSIYHLLQQPFMSRHIFCSICSVQRWVDLFLFELCRRRLMLIKHTETKGKDNRASLTPTLYILHGFNGNKSRIVTAATFSRLNVKRMEYTAQDFGCTPCTGVVIRIGLVGAAAEQRRQKLHDRHEPV